MKTIMEQLEIIEKATQELRKMIAEPMTYPDSFMSEDEENIIDPNYQK